jgi:hypothetical protein
MWKLEARGPSGSSAEPWPLPLAIDFGQEAGRWAPMSVLVTWCNPTSVVCSSGPFDPWEAEQHVLFGRRGVALD